MYVMLTTRPDLSYAVNYFSRYQHSQTEARWKGLKKILRYIKGTLNTLYLCYRKREVEELTCFVDADYGTEADRISTSGYLVKLFGNIVLWTTKRQTTVALSSTEAELVALATASTELIWIKNILQELGVTINAPPRIFEDNQSCIHLLERWEHKWLKHVDIKYNFIRHLYQRKDVTIDYLNTEDQIADILTKPLPSGKFVKLQAGLVV